MSKKKLLEKVRQTLKHGTFADVDDLVDVSEADDGSIHVVVVSRKFDGKRGQAIREVIWKDLMARLQQDEWSQVSLVIARSPEEIKCL